MSHRLFWERGCILGEGSSLQLKKVLKGLTTKDYVLAALLVKMETEALHS
jgi:hypothetical protein